jgi:hypothetical protein
MHTRLSSLCPVKFDPSIYVYLVIALGCDIRVLAAIIHGWPLLLDWGADETNRNEGMAALCEALKRFLSITHPWANTGNTRVAQNDLYLDYTEAFREVDENQDSQRCVVQWLKKEGSILVFVKVDDRHGVVADSALSLVDRQCGPDQGIVRQEHPHHMYLWVQRHTRDQNFQLKLEILHQEPLRFFTYEEQILSGLAMLMAAQSHYWRDKAPPPDVLNI